MSARSKARKRALDVLFAAEARGLDPRDVLRDRLADAEATPMGEFAESLVRGVAEHEEAIDDLIAQHSIDWTLDRMPAVDRTVLRIAVYEMAYGGEVDAAVAVDEAVELAKTLSTDDSPRFVNGVLAQIMAIAPRLGTAGS